jgi:hypothetical protein|tara:strand:+ start:518 stop:742 length:225 start_codon:yes stop_codon:yes gene_type:complete
MTQQELARKVKEYAAINYETHGWDIIVECYNEAMILAMLEEANIMTLHAAIKTVRDVAKMRDERRSEIQSTGEW